MLFLILAGIETTDRDTNTPKSAHYWEGRTNSAVRLGKNSTSALWIIGREKGWNIQFCCIGSGSTNPWDGKGSHSVVVKYVWNGGGFAFQGASNCIDRSRVSDWRIIWCGPGLIFANTIRVTLFDLESTWCEIGWSRCVGQVLLGAKSVVAVD